jgi:hypothetical protein
MFKLPSIAHFDPQGAIIAYVREEGTSNKADPTKWVAHMWSVRLPKNRRLNVRLVAMWDVTLEVKHYSPCHSTDGGWAMVLFASPSVHKWLWKLADFAYDQIEVARFNRANRAGRYDGPDYHCDL